MSLPIAPVADVDPLVLPFLEAADDERARELLGDLLIDCASPVLRPIIQRHLFSAGGAVAREQDAEDLQAIVLLRLTAQLWALRRGEQATPVANLQAYAATAAYNGCHEWMRERAPRRARLQSRVRYVLTRDPRLAMREVAHREWWCGARDVCGQPTTASDEDVRHSALDQLAIVRRTTGDPVNSPRAFAEFVRATLEALARPCRFVTLVSVLAECLGEQDAPAGSSGGGTGGGSGAGSTRGGRGGGGADSDADSRGSTADVERLPDERPTVADELTHRQHLTRLWAEIQALPPRQRAALLLNLRDDEGAGMIELWPQTGVAAMADLARALEVTEAELREIWPTLPRDDQWIAERLGVTRRQVINLRKCARERLSRRLRTMFAPSGGER